MTAKADVCGFYRGIVTVIAGSDTLSNAMANKVTATTDHREASLA